MPVYNGEKYLRDAIDSVLEQTFGDFDLLVINDGSTDSTPDIVSSYEDQRIRLIQNDRNLGITCTRNIGLAHARGEYIALLDSDDRALPDRFADQVYFLDKNPSFGMIGSWVELIDEKSNHMGETWKLDATPEQIPVLLLFNNYFAQSSLLIRRSAIPSNGYYNYSIGEDYDLWVRIAAQTKVWNLQKVLTCYRVHAASTTFEKDVLKEQCLREIITSQLVRMGIHPTLEELEIHRSIHRMKAETDQDSLYRTGQWLLKLLQAEHVERYYVRSVFNGYLGAKWFQLCSRSTKLGMPALFGFYAFPLCRWAHTEPHDIIRFWVRCLLKR